MNHSEIAALMKGVAPVIRDLVKAHVAPLEQRIEELQKEIDAERNRDVAGEVSRMVADAVAALPPAQPAGTDADTEEVARLIDAAVSEAVAALPKPQHGKSVTVEDVAPLLSEMVEKAVAAIPPAEPGKPGAPGKLPLAKAWDGEVTYEAEVRTHNGALWQAVRDTGREPGHEDWICLATPGAPGRDADQIEIAGTFDPGKANAYRRLNIVALNGGAFIAKQDAPGDCPGEGWQVIAMRGKAGPPGQSVKGDPGKSIKGDPGEAVVSMSVDEQGMLTLVNGDGTEVECDLYPVLSKIGGR